MKSEQFKIESKGIVYLCHLDQQGMVWYEDKFGNHTNIGQTEKVSDLDSAKKTIIKMLQCTGL